MLKAFKFSIGFIMVIISIASIFYLLGTELGDTLLTIFGVVAISCLGLGSVFLFFVFIIFVISATKKTLEAGEGLTKLFKKLIDKQS